MTIDRRRFLGNAAGMLAVATTGGIVNAATRPRPIGLQLYTVRELFERDPAGTLAAVAKIGYREVEFGGGGYDKMDPAMLRRTMDQHGLTAPSLHVPYEILRSDFAKATKLARTLGSDTIVVPYLMAADRTQNGFARVVADVNRFAVQARNEGLGIAYHNHDFEFTTRFGGTSLYDTLVTGTDPALVKLELDLYWAVHAGEDAARLIDRLSGRLYAFHVKDMRADRSMTSVGAGTIDFARLFARPGAAAVKHFYVENDEAPAPYLPDITASFKTLAKLRS